MKSPLLAWIARLGVTAIGGTFAILVVVQYARIVERNFNYMQQVRSVQGDIVKLQAKKDRQLRTIRRLSDPEGSIPEIHDRLHLVGPKEEIIYLKRPGGDANP